MVAMTHRCCQQVSYEFKRYGSTEASSSCHVLIVVTAGCPFERLKGLWLFAQDPLEGASEALAFGNADVAMIAVAPFRTVQ
jgi:hypothetical protein